MKLELSVKEVETILLEWAEQKWPRQFNTVELKQERYGSGFEGRKFTKAQEVADEAAE